MNVDFVSKGGRQTQTVQIYRDIDELGKLATRGREGPSDYSMTKNRFTGGGSKRNKSKSRSGSRGRSKDRKSDGSLTRGFG